MVDGCFFSLENVQAIACQRPLETIQRPDKYPTKQHNVVYSIFAHNSVDIMRMYGFDLTCESEMEVRQKACGTRIDGTKCVCANLCGDLCVFEEARGWSKR